MRGETRIQSPAPPDFAGRRALGEAAEERAARQLEAAGLRILVRNYRCRMGELDIVASDGATLVIAEVRLRSSERFGGAAASITWKKRRRIVRATRHLICLQPHLASLPIRFDVLVAQSGQGDLEWIRGAFDAG